MLPRHILHRNLHGIDAIMTMLPLIPVPHRRIAVTPGLHGTISLTRAILPNIFIHNHSPFFPVLTFYVNNKRMCRILWKDTLGKETSFSKKRRPDILDLFLFRNIPVFFFTLFFYSAALNFFASSNSFTIIFSGSSVHKLTITIRREEIINAGSRQ